MFDRSIAELIRTVRYSFTWTRDKVFGFWTNIKNWYNRTYNSAQLKPNNYIKQIKKGEYEVYLYNSGSVEARGVRVKLVKKTLHGDECRVLEREITSDTYSTGPLNISAGNGITTQIEKQTTLHSEDTVFAADIEFKDDSKKYRKGIRLYLDEISC